MRQHKLIDSERKSISSDPMAKPTTTVLSVSKPDADGDVLLIMRVNDGGSIQEVASWIKQKSLVKAGYRMTNVGLGQNIDIKV